MIEVTIDTQQIQQLTTVINNNNLATIIGNTDLTTTMDYNNLTTTIDNNRHFLVFTYCFDSDFGSRKPLIFG